MAASVGKESDRDVSLIRFRVRLNRRPRVDIDDGRFAVTGDARLARPPGQTSPGSQGKDAR